MEENEDGSFLVITRPDKSFGEVVDGLKEAGLEPADAEVTMSPSTEAEIDADGELQSYLDDVQRRRILEALEQTRWNKTRAAKQLGISFRALRYRLQKLDIEKH